MVLGHNEEQTHSERFCQHAACKMWANKHNTIDRALDLAWPSFLIPANLQFEKAGSSGCGHKEHTLHENLIFQADMKPHLSQNL